MRRVLIDLALIAAFALCGAQTVAPETFHLRAADLVIQITPSIPGGHLILSLGPVGDLTWKTHDAPIDVHARFLIRRSSGNLPDARDLRDLRFAFLLRKIGWLLATGALIGALVARGSARARLHPILIGAGGLAAAATLTVVAAVVTFNAAALRDPRYRGPISDAPRVLELIKDVQHDWSGVQRNINAAVQGLESLHDQVLAAQPPSHGNTVRFLLVSDVHNNPIGLLIAKELVKRFDVAAVLNAGDLTDRGTAAEGELYARFSDLGVPQIVTPGNHEDAAGIARIKLIPKTTVLQSTGTDTANVDGITILGDQDPNATSIADDPFNAAAQEQMPGLCDALAIRWRLLRPQILMVHDPRQGRCAAADARNAGAPLVFVWGHTHKQAYDANGSVIGVSDGTSGGGGIKVAHHHPYGFGLLEFDVDTREPVSVCLFSFDDPATLRDTTCHIVHGPLAGSPNPAPTSTPAG